MPSVHRKVQRPAGRSPASALPVQRTPHAKRVQKREKSKPGSLEGSLRANDTLTSTGMGAGLLASVPVSGGGSVPPGPMYTGGSGRRWHGQRPSQLRPTPIVELKPGPM
eukprot:281427-Chlamydomonas_euryale.AAC.3